MIREEEPKARDGEGCTMQMSLAAAEAALVEFGRLGEVRPQKAVRLERSHTSRLIGHTDRAFSVATWRPIPMSRNQYNSELL